MKTTLRNQAKTQKPTDPNAHLARGVEGAQPPLEQEGAHLGHRHTVAAGLYSIYETAHFGIKEKFRSAPSGSPQAESERRIRLSELRLAGPRR